MTRSRVGNRYPSLGIGGSFLEASIGFRTRYFPSSPQPPGPVGCCSGDHKGACMKYALPFVAALALLAPTACNQTGRQQAEGASVQLPGQPPTANAGLTRPPDEWAAPPRPRAASRPTQTASAP